MHYVHTRLVRDWVCLTALLLAACGGGGVGGAVAPVSTTSARASTVPRFAYVANAEDNTVSIYAVNATTGQLRHSGYVAAGSSPRSVAVDPAGRFAYVANYNSNDISAYRIDASTGALTTIACDKDVTECNGGNFATGGLNPVFITVDASGSFVFVVNEGDNSMLVYLIATNGVLIPWNPIKDIGSSTTGSPRAVSIDPAGQFAIVASANGGITTYRFNINNGSWSHLYAVYQSAGTTPDSIAIAPTGKFAYVANAGSNNITSYSIGANSPDLAFISNASTGNHPTSLTIDPTGRFVYVANIGEHSVYNANVGQDTISAYKINASTGELTSIGPDMEAGPDPLSYEMSITIDPSGKFLYTSCRTTNLISAYSIDAETGALTPLPAVAGRNGGMAMAISSGDTPTTYSPKHAYVVNTGDNSISAYTINAGSGALTPVVCYDQCNGSNFQTGGVGPTAIATDPAGRFAYVTNSNTNNLSCYTINDAGALFYIGSIPTGYSPQSISVDPSGRFVYVANSSSGDISSYTIGSSGALTPNGKVGLGNGSKPYSVTVDPSGRLAYVANTGNPGSVSVFNIDTSTGVLTRSPSTWAGVDATAGNLSESIVVDPSGRFVYVSNVLSGDISAFAIDTWIGSNGRLFGINTENAGPGSRSLAFEPTGRFAYSADNDAGTVSVFSINAGNGAITRTGGVTLGLPAAVTVDTSGKFVYVTDSAYDSTVSVYAIGTNGNLTSIGGAKAGAYPVAVTTTGTWQ